MVCARTSALKKWGTLPGGYVAGEGWKDKEHMGGKPLKLMLAVVSDYSRKGDLVCDPCLGGGTTLVACVKLGRHGIGIERDPETFDKACRRIEATLREPDMFIDQPEPAKTPSMFEEPAA
jgi:site-specific DNA-methyltransferase (adenine-specific)